jgi:2-oxoglutarate ferredoxin oxidoreductase subunit alpha
MTLKRQKKVDIIANFIPELEILGEQSAELLVLSWGGVFGSVKSAVKKAQESGLSVSHAHLRYLNPFPRNLGEMLLKFDKILIPELNLGQLLAIIRAKFLVNATGFNKIAGKPFSSDEILNEIKLLIGKE